MADNMKLYNTMRDVPEKAKKTITGGRLSGMTDINPMWRIEKLTEVFGPCGIGWWYEITSERVLNDEISRQTACFVDINLYVVDPETGVTSHPIVGTGGSMLVTQEKNGPYLSDEGFKMALTDAISIAGKALGLGADVWFKDGRDKYTAQQPTQPDKKAAVKPPVQPPQNGELVCEGCGIEIEQKVYDFSGRVYGKHLCRECQKKAKKV